MLPLLVIACIPFLTIAVIHKQATLNAKQISQNGAIVIHNPLVAQISGTSYQIQVGPQEDDYDIKVSLDNTWGFKPARESTMEIIIDGFTPPPQQDPPDADLLFIFSVNDLQYFSFFLHLDEYNIKSKIYPSLTGNTRNVSEWIADNTIHDRYNRISDNNAWIDLLWKKQAVWPLRFVITNNPITDTSSFQFYHNNSLNHVTGYFFSDSSWTTESNIDIFLMGDSTGERYNVFSFDIQLLDNFTATPTVNTLNPTPTPTLMPTIYPTSSPTHNPSLQPSTISPTLPPTDAPTTDAPTIRPSVSPTTDKPTTATETINYGVVITITFQYKFTLIDKEQIIRVLDQIANILNEDRDCPDFDLYSPHFIEMNNITKVNCTITVCDKSQQEQILIAVEDVDLQTDIINLIDNATDSSIYPNKTIIIANDIILSDIIQSTSTSNNTNSDDIDIFSDDSHWIKPVKKDPLFWMVIFIAAQIASCFLLIGCIVFIKLKTNKYKRKRSIMQEVKRNIRQHRNLALPTETEPGSRHQIESISHRHDHDVNRLEEEVLDVIPPEISASKPYKLRSLEQQQNNESLPNSISHRRQNELNPLRKKSPPISRKQSMRNYKTRGVSEDIYGNDANMMTHGRKISDMNAIYNIPNGRSYGDLDDMYEDDGDNELKLPEMQHTQEGARVNLNIKIINGDDDEINDDQDGGNITSPSYVHSPISKYPSSESGRSPHAEDKRKSNDQKKSVEDKEEEESNINDGISPTPTIQFRLPTYQVTKGQWM